MWNNNVKSGRPKMTMWRMRITCWIPKATNTHSVYVRSNIYCVSNATKFAKTSINVTLNVYCLYCHYRAADKSLVRPD